MKKIQKSKTVVVEKPEPTVLEQIAWQRREIEWRLDLDMERCQETKQKFLEAVQKNDPADLDLGYLVKRYAEDIFLASVREREVLCLAGAYKRVIDAQDGGVALVLDLLQKAKAREEARLLESPYRHSSTCVMSNFHQECEVRAKADFWHGGGFGRSSVGEIIQCLEKWLAFETEVLDAYRSRS